MTYYQYVFTLNPYFIYILPCHVKKFLKNKDKRVLGRKRLEALVCGK